MKKQKITKKFIQDRVKHYQEKMLLTHYDIAIKYLDEDYDNIAITINQDCTYQRATLHVRPTVFTDSLENVDEYIKHEMVHIILQPLSDLAEEHASWKRIEKPLENAVEHIRRIIL